MVHPRWHTWWARANNALIFAAVIAGAREVMVYRFSGWPAAAIIGAYCVSQGLQLLCLGRRPEAQTLARSAIRWGWATTMVGAVTLLGWPADRAFGIPRLVSFMPPGFYFLLVGLAWLWVIFLAPSAPLQMVVWATTDWPVKLPLYLARRARARWAVLIVFVFLLVTIVLGNLGTCHQLREIRQELSTLQHR